MTEKTGRGAGFLHDMIPLVVRPPPHVLPVAQTRVGVQFRLRLLDEFPALAGKVEGAVKAPELEQRGARTADAFVEVGLKFIKSTPQPGEFVVLIIELHPQVGDGERVRCSRPSRSVQLLLNPPPSKECIMGLVGKGPSAVLGQAERGCVVVDDFGGAVQPLAQGLKRCRPVLGNGAKTISSIAHPTCL